jgi:hypothetical protein
VGGVIEPGRRGLLGLAGLGAEAPNTVKAAMVDRTAEEVRANYISKMGRPLGEQFNALWQEVALLHLNWKEYVELFGTNAERVEHLNRAAPAFFRMIQDQLWTVTLLHIARLLDSPRSAGKANLTLRNLTDLAGAELKAPLAELIDKAIADAAFARDWRNRVIAHSDLGLALQDGTATPLEEASRASVNVVLKSIADVMNEVENHYTKSGTMFDGPARQNAAVTLLQVIEDGIRASTEREERILQMMKASPDQQST